jgi:hypothetical protein
VPTYCLTHRCTTEASRQAKAKGGKKIQESGTERGKHTHTPTHFSFSSTRNPLATNKTGTETLFLDHHMNTTHYNLLHREFDALVELFPWLIATMTLDLLLLIVELTPFSSRFLIWLKRIKDG